MKILHLSDLHIGKSETEAENLGKIVNFIVGNEQWHGDKPIIVITGDLVDDGKKEQFAEARQILEPLYQTGFTVLAVPGNHDYGWNGVHAREKRFPLFKNAFFKYESVTYPHVKEIDGHIFVGLNSMKAETGFFDGLLADGELGSRQINDTLDRLKDFEGRPPEKKVVIYLHHHPFLYPDDNELEEMGEKIGHWLKDGDDFMHKISKYRVDILLFGHEHRHLDFSSTEISKKYGIPAILSSGKSTKKSVEYEVTEKGHANKDQALNEGLMGRIVEIAEDGVVTSGTVVFPS